MAGIRAANQSYGTGRRKTSTARVFLANGGGKISVNKQPLDEYFGRETARMIVRQPLEVAEVLGCAALAFLLATPARWNAKKWVCTKPASVPNTPSASPHTPKPAAPRLFSWVLGCRGGYFRPLAAGPMVNSAVCWQMLGASFER
jgi:hypothetical protein